jgi:cbb3-type cytochrome oxidase subunit 3
MPGSGTAEIYFIAAMMILILIISFASVFFFFRQYKKEMANKAKEKQVKSERSITQDDERDN